MLGFSVKDKLLFAIDAKTDSCGEEILDMEFLIPVSSGFQSNENYIFKPRFKLENAVKIRHFGSLATLERSRAQLQQHLLAHELHPITNYYYVVVKSAQDHSEDNIIDIYVGVNGNIV